MTIDDVEPVLRYGVPVRIGDGPEVMLDTLPDGWTVVVYVNGEVVMPQPASRGVSRIPGTPYEIFMRLPDPAGAFRLRLARNSPEGTQAAVSAGHCIDFRQRVGGRVRLASRVTIPTLTSPWSWRHVQCARYNPAGQPADFYGGAPDWRTAWAYAANHMRNFHGIELGAAGWHVGYPTH